MPMRTCPRLVMMALVLATVTAGLGCTAQSQQARRDALAREHLETARQYIEQGLVDSALSAFGMALEENPKLIDAHLGIGEIYREMGDYARAKNAYESAVETDPNNFDANYYLALMRQYLGEVDEAINAYLRALAIDPNNFDANRDIASAFLQAGRLTEALPYAVRATHLNGDSQEAWTNLAATYSLLQRYDNAVDAYRQAAELGELKDPVLLGLADAHIRLENYDRSINVLESLLSRSPSSTAYERLGYAQFKQRDFDLALKNFRRALALDDQDTAALNGVGACLMTEYINGERQERIYRDQAIAVWRRSVRLRPEQPRIVDLLSRYGRM